MPNLPEDDWEDVSGLNPTPASQRVELMGLTVGVGESYYMVDPEHEVPGQPAGIQRNDNIAMLDLHGHLHPPGLDMCVPVSVPFLLSANTLDTLIESLTEARDKLAALPSPDVDRG